MFSITVIYEFLRAHAKTLIVGVGFLLVFAVAYTLGWQKEHNKLTAYKASVAQQAADQERRTAEIVKRHKADKEAIHEDYQTRLADLRRDYERRMRDKDGSGPVSTTADAASRADDPAVDTRSLERSALLERCAETSLQLEELQSWIRRTR